MAETAAARRFLRSKIAPVLTTAGWTWTPTGGASGPRLSNGPAPAGMPYPLVRLDLLSPGNDQRVINGDHIWTNTLWMIKAVTAGSSTSGIEPVVNSIHAVLHNSGGGVSGGLIIACWRERPHERIEVTDGEFYVNLGGEWRVQVQEA